MKYKITWEEEELVGIINLQNKDAVIRFLMTYYNILSKNETIPEGTIQLHIGGEKFDL